MADMIPQGRTDLGDGTGYEKADANLRAVGISMVIILAICVVSFAAMAGMMRYYLIKAAEADARVPDIYVKHQVPPKPRLLPSPFGGSEGAVTLSGVNPQVVPLEQIDTTTDAVLPWDKMRLENEAAARQANGYTYNPKTGAVTMPIDRAMDEMARGQRSEYSGNPATTHSNLPDHYGQVASTSAAWESAEQKFSADAAGGLNLNRR